MAPPVNHEGALSPAELAIRDEEFMRNQYFTVPMRFGQSVDGTGYFIGEVASYQATQTMQLRKVEASAFVVPGSPQALCSLILSKSASFTAAVGATGNETSTWLDLYFPAQESLARSVDFLGEQEGLYLQANEKVYVYMTLQHVYGTAYSIEGFYAMGTFMLYFLPTLRKF